MHEAHPPDVGHSPIRRTLIDFAHKIDSHINYVPVLENVVHQHGHRLGYPVSAGRIGILERDFIVHGRNGDEHTTSRCPSVPMPRSRWSR